MVARREGGAVRTYVHFGTGNYHPITAKIYTDLSFFTCDPALVRDAARLFNFISSYAHAPGAGAHLTVTHQSESASCSNISMRRVNMPRRGASGQIWAKMNSLVDPDVIDALYRASHAGCAG